MAGSPRSEAERCTNAVGIAVDMKITTLCAKGSINRDHCL